MDKQVLFLLVLLCSVTFCQAGYYTVGNQPEHNADFTSIQSAVEYASSYDTIYVMGSPINYGNVLLEKPLVLKGEGANDQLQSEHTSKLTRILLTSNPYRRTISSGSSIVGFEFPFFPGKRANIVTVGGASNKITDITLERNWLWFIDVVGEAENWTIRNNIIRGWFDGRIDVSSDESYGAKDFVFENNIINSLKGFDTAVVSNNVFLGRLKNIVGSEIHHNIFIREGPFLDNVGRCHFHNNVAVSSKVGKESCYESAEVFESDNHCMAMTNTGNNNRVGVDPGFGYIPSKGISGGAVFEPGNTLVEKGSDGSKIGIFGGNSPFPSSTFMEPEITNPFSTFVVESIY